MTWALVLGGAKNVYDDLNAAIEKFGDPDCIVGVKDISIEYPRIDHWATFHLDRIPRELDRRRKLGYPDPQVVWTYTGVRDPKNIPIKLERMNIRGGSSGLLGAMVGITVANFAILAGIPMDESMPHFHSRKDNKPWHEGRLYKPHWTQLLPTMQGKVKSMSGWTREILGEPTSDWLFADVQVKVPA